MSDMAQRVFSGMAERLEALQAFDYESLVGAGLGEALTRAELEGLVGKPDEVAFLAAHCRQQAAQIAEASV
jgi:hypothetical protein